MAQETLMVSSQFRYFAETGPPPRADRIYAEPLFRSARPGNMVPRLLACVEDGDLAQAVSQHALAIACSLGLEVTFARVIEPPGETPGHFTSPADPVEWQLRRRVQHESLSKFAQQDEAQVKADSVLLAGTPAEELSNWAADHGATMLAMGRCQNGKSSGLGSTAQALLDRADHSLLLVPPGLPHNAGYRRIMVPVDGSARADSVLPIARRIARTHAADLILVHIVPQLEVVGTTRGLLLEQLRTQIVGHNQRNASQHLGELRRRSMEAGVDVKTITRGPGDPRPMLRDLAIEEQADLIVMASHGNTALEDVPCGSVTEYMAIHAPVPLLIVRPNIRCAFGMEPPNCRNVSAFRFDG